MSQSIFAFVLVSALAISSPVQGAVIKTDLVSQAVLCAGLKYTAPGVSSLYDACVASKLVVASNAIVERSTAKTGLTTATCTSLDLKVLGARQLYDACVAAGLLVTADVNTKNNVLAVGTATDVRVNAFLNAMNDCQSLSLQLYSVVAGIARLTSSTVVSLSADVIVPILVKVNASLNDAVVATTNLAACTDAAVEANVVQGYNAFAASLNDLLAALSTSLSLYASVEVKASLNATLAALRATLVTYTTQLDNYVSYDLAKSSIKAILFVSLDAALKATSC